MGAHTVWSSRFLGSSAVATRPFLVVVELGVGDAGARGKRMGWSAGSGRKRIPVGDSGACSASFEDAAGVTDGSATRNLTDDLQKLAVAKESRDAFRSAPPAALMEDEFFARMNLALEASRHASSRASSTSTSSFFEGSSLNTACEPPRTIAGHGGDSPTPPSPPELCELPRSGVQLPSSIQKLRRRKEEPAGCAIKRAFASMVYIIKALQSHALQIRQLMFAETWDLQEVVHLVHKEMYASFVWLFQRVFACTPKLMLSVMILLANFTVFSMGENLAVATLTETDHKPPAIAYFLTANAYNPQVPFAEFANGGAGDAATTATEGLTAAAGGKGNFRFPGFRVAEGFDEDAWLTGARKEQVQLAQEIETRRLVPPHLEDDDYGCFDRTELDYQLAIAKDPGSPVLLANYAQFLFVVRRNPNRAEEYFHRAMESDPRDSTILDRFANFLWLGRGDRLAAERVYKAAFAADPESSYSAGNYAHFLWHAEDRDSNNGHGHLAA